MCGYSGPPPTSRSRRSRKSRSKRVPKTTTASARFELVYASPGGRRRSCRSSAWPAPTLSRAGTLTLAAEDLGVQPGDVITYYARARDVGRGKQPTETRSDIFFLEVRPFSEEFVLAQSQAMSGMASEQIETLIAAQKEIINATWNIERRASSGAGRSASDVTAIAAAQSRVEDASGADRAAAQAAAAASIRFPQQVVLPQRAAQAQRPAPSDPVGAAISAMSRAIGQLEGPADQRRAAARDGGAPGVGAGAGRGPAARGRATGRRVDGRHGPPGPGPVGALRQGAAASAAHQLRDAVAGRDAARSSGRRERARQDSRSGAASGGARPAAARAREPDAVGRGDRSVSSRS